MTFQRAKVELQYGSDGWSLVAKNPETGYAVIANDVDRENVESVFGEEVVEDK